MKVRIKDAGNKRNGTAKVAIECILLQAKSEHIGVMEVNICLGLFNAHFLYKSL